MRNVMLTILVSFFITSTAFAVVVDQEKLYYGGSGYLLYFTDSNSDNYHTPGETYYAYPYGSDYNYDASCWYASACAILEGEGYSNPYLTGLRDGAAYSPATTPWGGTMYANSGNYRTFDDGGWQHLAFDFLGYDYQGFIKADSEFGSGSWSINPIDWSLDRIAEEHGVGVCLYSGLLMRGAIPTGYKAGDRSFYHAITVWEINEYNGTMLITDSDDQVYSSRTVDYAYTGNDWVIYDLYPGADAHINYAVSLAGTPGPDVEIDMIPNNPPIYVNPGGYFTFTGILDNNTTQTQYTDVWIVVEMPQGWQYGPIQVFYNVYLNPYQHYVANGVRQNIPWYALLGDYDYIAYCGDYPNNKMDSASFPFTIVAGAGSDNDTWNLTRWIEDNPEIPIATELLGNYPNPFNAQTTISFNLRSADNVNLSVYNLGGQKVETLVNGYREAGYHAVNFDASTLSSGVYFYKLQIGSFVTTKKMNLLK
ncbi:MAG: T9SS type A sorting domain-containing protein [candidate division Zixibacteria bacterium]|nr:T9SS type A sorting domain-containing protein [candidate division Zixibacteria bacterium]